MFSFGFLISLLAPSMIPSYMNLDTASLADGAYSRMSWRYEKSFLFFSVEVLDLEIRFGRREREEFRGLLEGRGKLPAEIEQQVVSTALAADDVLITVRFLRNIQLERFIREARNSTRLAYQSGVIQESELKRVKNNLPCWYSSLRSRNIRASDEMFYRIQHQSMHTVFLGADGKVYVDQIDEGEGPGRTVLGGYLAEGSKFRAGLIQSLIEAGS